MKSTAPLLLCAALASLAAEAQPAQPTEATAGQKPVIVNMAADGVVNFVLHTIEQPFGKGATREMALAALDKEVDQYQGLGVSHLFWNVNYQRVGYNSAAWPSYWDMPDPEKQVTEWPRTYYELHKLGIDDVFARLIPRCRERGISPWISLRMNDHHYTGDPSRVSPLLFDHPELRHHRGKGLFNYARPEVREHYLKLVSEVLQRYDVDGLYLFNHFEAVGGNIRLRTPAGKNTNECTVAQFLHAAGDWASATRLPRVHALAYTGRHSASSAWVKRNAADRRTAWIALSSCCRN